MQPVVASASVTTQSVGTGGFLDPIMIVEQFGIEKGMSIADFGSGAGYFTILLAEKVGSDGIVHALDVMERSLDSVRSKARVSGVDNVETIRTNLEILGGSSLSDGSQDVVLMANILFQSQKREDVMKEGRRVLKKGGELIIIDWKKGTGGFGPPNDLRPDEADIQTMAGKNGFVMTNRLNTGQFHFGLVFKKQ